MTNKVGPGGVELSDTVLLGGGIAVLLVAVGAAWWIKNRVADAGAAAADAAKATAEYVAHDAVNVTSGKNVATTAVNVAGQALGIFGTNDFTGQPNTLGSGLEEAGRKISEWFK